MSLTIRMAERLDYSGICQLFAQGDAFHAQTLPDRFSISHPARSEAFFIDLLNSTEHHLVVAEHGHVLVGLIEFRVVTLAARPPVTARTFLSIDSLIVNEAHRRHGIGRRLMHDIEQWAADRAIATIELNVYASNQPAMRLYEELGYSLLSQRMEKKLDC